MIGIIDWRLDQCGKAGVAFEFNRWAEADDVVAFGADIVLVATGGTPDMNGLEQGDDLTVSPWDILGKTVRPGMNVLLYDEVGDHTGLQTAEVIANAGGSLEVIAPDRAISRDVMGVNLVPYMRNLQDKNVMFTVGHRLKSVVQEGNELMASIGTDYSDYRYEKTYDQVIVNKGVVPNDDLYFDLKPLSANLGVVDYDALIAGKAQPTSDSPDAGFRLYRIGDAVSGRNIHAAIYDALRLVRTI